MRYYLRCRNRDGASTDYEVVPNTRETAIENLRMLAEPGAYVWGLADGR